MNVAQLIDELERMPQGAPVKVVPAQVYLIGFDEEFDLCDDNATEATEVQCIGGYVVVRGK